MLTTILSGFLWKIRDCGQYISDLETVTAAILYVHTQTVIVYI
jgi:hypothetical protein